MRRTYTATFTHNLCALERAAAAVVVFRDNLLVPRYSINSGGGNQ